MLVEAYYMYLGLFSDPERDALLKRVGAGFKPAPTNYFDLTKNQISPNSFCRAWVA